MSETKRQPSLKNKRQPSLKKLFSLDLIAKENDRRNRSRPTNHSPGGWATTASPAADPASRKAPSSSPETPATTNTSANSSSFATAASGGSSRRVHREEYMWLRRALKLHAAKYISDALEAAQLSRQQLADEMGVSLGRVHQLLTIRGQFQYERVPLDLLYQVQDITGRRFEMPSKICTSGQAHQAAGARPVVRAENSRSPERLFF